MHSRRTELDSSLESSLYSQLKDILLNKILSGEWSNGEKIPNEYELCKMYNVSRITVRQALAELTKKGYLVRKQGSGTYVSIPKIEHNLTSFYSFTEEFRKRGFSPSTKVLEFHMQIARKEIARKLGLGEGSKEVYYIKRLRFADNTPVALESTYIPAALFRNLNEEDLEVKALYDIMREQYGVVPSTAEESISAVNLGEKEAIYLGVDKGVAVLQVERFTYNLETCIEYTIGFIRSDVFSFHVKLDRP
ncbi:MAG TPA: GntR family transcriptional regulator [Clostridiaceae bacterium]|nr:GntR family transcriptional regulator [Clostridiaceae bacterium]